VIDQRGYPKFEILHAAQHMPLHCVAVWAQDTPLSVEVERASRYIPFPEDSVPKDGGGGA
jgi:hypothetical protein